MNILARFLERRVHIRVLYSLAYELRSVSSDQLVAHSSLKNTRQVIEYKIGHELGQVRSLKNLIILFKSEWGDILKKYILKRFEDILTQTNDLKRVGRFGSLLISYFDKNITNTNQRHKFDPAIQLFLNKITQMLADCSNLRSLAEIVLTWRAVLFDYDIPDAVRAQVEETTFRLLDDDHCQYDVEILVEVSSYLDGKSKARLRAIELIKECLDDYLSQINNIDVLDKSTYDLYRAVNNDIDVKKTVNDRKVALLSSPGALERIRDINRIKSYLIEINSKDKDFNEKAVRRIEELL